MPRKADPHAETVVARPPLKRINEDSITQEYQHNEFLELESEFASEGVNLTVKAGNTVTEKAKTLFTVAELLRSLRHSRGEDW